MTEILVIIINISVCMLPIIMLIENLIKRRYNILNIGIILNLFTWTYISFIRNIRNPGFRVKCDVRILMLIAIIVFIASIIIFAVKLRKNKKNSKWLILIAVILVFGIIMTNDPSYPKRTLVEDISEKQFRNYILQEHVAYLGFLSIEIELMMNLLGTQKRNEEIEENEEES